MGKSTQRKPLAGPTGSSILPNVIEVGRLYYVQDLNDEYSRTIAICVGSENARLVERALNALRSNAAGERPETRSEVAGTHDPIVRLWVVVEEDRGMGVTACSCHASEEDANTHCSGHKFADPVDVPWSVLESLKPNAKDHESRARPT